MQITVTFDTCSGISFQRMNLILNPTYKSIDLALTTCSYAENNHFSITLNKLRETARWDVSYWDEAVWVERDELVVNMPSNDALTEILNIISSNSFPKGKNVSSLTKGELNQLRDAMIFETHLKYHRSIFVTDDEKGFIKNGRREKLESIFNTRILTLNEFLAQFPPTFDAQILP